MGPQITINFVDDQAQQMLQRIRSGLTFQRAKERAARQIAPMITVPQDTGELQRSLRGRGDQVIATATNQLGVPYAGFVFRGDGPGERAPQPPDIPERAAGILAQECYRQAFYSP